jgi:hypothetical protein
MVSHEFSGTMTRLFLMTVPHKLVPKHKTYSDGKGGTLTEKQWRALSEAERDRIWKQVNAQIAKVVREGIA